MKKHSHSGKGKRSVNKSLKISVRFKGRGNDCRVEMKKRGSEKGTRRRLQSDEIVRVLKAAQVQPGGRVFRGRETRAM